MSKPSDKGFDQTHCKPTTASAADTTAVRNTKTTDDKIIIDTTNNPITPAEYIYNTMIPPSTSTETAEVPSLGKRDRCNTGGSVASAKSPMMSMDLAFLSHDDVALDGGLGAMNSSDFSGMRIQSSDFVKDLLTDNSNGPVVGSDSAHLPDSAVTAAAALKAEEEDVEPLPALPSCDENPIPCSSNGGKPHADGDCPMMLNLTAKLERISTGESVVPLSDNIRITSSEWVKDFESDAAGMGAMHPSLFRDNSGGTPAARSPPPVSHSNNVPQDRESFEEYQVPLQSSLHSLHNHVPSLPPLSNPGHAQQPQHLPMPPLSNPNVVHNLPTTSPVASATKNSTSPSSSTTSKKRKKKRTIDVTRAIEPTDDDVLFGRGGYTNTHPGNIRFREKALELRPWYESVSKEEKYNISQILIDSVKGEGHRFLEKGPDKLWHEVIGNGARKKASQALRERIKGSRRKASAGGGGDHSSSIKSAGSAGSAARGNGGRVNVEEDLEELMPADVVGI